MLSFHTRYLISIKFHYPSTKTRTNMYSVLKTYTFISGLQAGSELNSQVDTVVCILFLVTEFI